MNHVKIRLEGTPDSVAELLRLLQQVLNVEKVAEPHELIGGHQGSTIVYRQLTVKVDPPPSQESGLSQPRIGDTKRYGKHSPLLTRDNAKLSSRKGQTHGWKE